jgi:hypothetical protein
MLSGRVFFAFHGGADAFAGEDGGERGGDVEIEGVAELVEFGGAVGLDAGSLVAGVVAADVGAAERAEQLAQGLVAEEVHGLVGDFEAGVGLGAVTLLTLLRVGLLGVDEVLFLELLDDLVDEFVDLLGVERVEFFLGLFVEELAGFEGLADGLAEVVEGLVAELLEVGVGVLEARVEQEVGERLHEILEAEGGGEVAGELGVADALHGWASLEFIPLRLRCSMDWTGAWTRLIFV